MTDFPDSSGTVSRGAFLLTLFQLVSKVFYLLFFVLLGNLPDTLYGKIEGLLVLGSTFFILSDFGIEAWLTRELANNPEGTTARLPRIASLKVTLTGLAGFLLAVWIFRTVATGWEEVSGLTWIVFGCGVYMTALSFQSYLRSISRAHQRFEVEGRMAVADKFLTLVLGGIALMFFQSVLGLMWTFALASSMATLYGWIRVSRFQPRLAPMGAPDFSVLRAAYPFALSSICILLFYYMDRLMVFQLIREGDVALARYSRGYRIVMGLLLFPQMMSVAIYPMFSKLSLAPEERINVGRSSLRTLLFLALPLVVGGWVVGGGLLDLLFPHGDPEAPSWVFDRYLGWDASSANLTEAAVLRVLLLSLPFPCCNYLFGPALNAIGKERLNLAASATSLVANIGLNLFLIPRLGPVGAAGATTVTQFLYAVVLYSFLRKTDTSWFDGSAIGRYLGISLAMGTVLLLLDQFPVVVSIPMGGVVYGGAVWFLGGWPEDIRILLPRRFRKSEP